jgi:predicted phage terminase large subunit-like protein
MSALPQNLPAFSAVDIDRALCKASLFEFLKLFWHVIIAEEPVWNWHIKYLCDELQKAAERVIGGLPKEYDIVINIPPGTTKSTIVSVMLDAWMKSKMPSCRFLGASYAHSLAQNLSRLTREIIKSDLYRKLFPEVQIREDQDAKGDFEIEGGGNRFAVGSGGVVVGRHYHTIAVDDPIDPNSAVSETELNIVNTWINSTLSQRKVNKQVTLTILVMQRLAQGDPTESFMDQGGKVKHICLPADTDYPIKPPELKAHYINGLLDPVRLPQAILDLEKKRGDYFYAGQMGQSPCPAGGGMFLTDKLVIERPHPLVIWRKLVRFWDKAASKKKRSAFSVGVKMGLDQQGRYWILDVVRDRWNSAARERKILQTAQADGFNCLVGIEQEGGSGGIDSAESTVRNLAGFRTRIVPAREDKELRVDAFSCQVNVGNVYVAPAGWNKVYIDEMRLFPYSKFKDQMDASGGAFNTIAGARVTVGGMGL